MATKVVMAQLSPTMEEGRLLEWKVEEGDRVEPSDVLAEIETDKANMDIEAMGGGVVRKLLVEEGATVPVGAIIGVIGEEDEDISELLEEAKASLEGAAPAAEPEAEAEPAEAEEEAAEPESEEAAEPEAEAEETVGTAEDETGEEAAEPEAGDEREPAAKPGPAGEAREPEEAGKRERAAGERVRISPVARRMAEDAGVDPSAIEGSGPGGRIVKADVERAIESGTARRAAPAEAGGKAAPAPEAGPVGPARLEEKEIPLSQMRKAIAKRLAQSIGPVPHFFLTTEIDMGRALDLRAEMNARIAPEKIGVNDLLVKATAEALARHPEINASWEGDRIRRHGSVDVGIAVAVEDGLITPVLREADRKGLVRIKRESDDLIARGREKKLAPEEYQGATFSVSNLGMFDIDQFTAIINPPEAAILAVGSTVEKPVVVDGEVVVRRRMRVTMSCDHRVIDGATGARFLQTFKAMMENPLEMLL